MRKISLAITTYNRYELLLESFSKVYNDDRISEIVILDDHSTDGSYEKLQDAFKWLDEKNKIQLYQNDFNLDCYHNKRSILNYVNNDWVILLDSDNSITTEYLDAIYAIEHWDENIFYQPEFAKPHFDFRKYSGMYFDKKNIAAWIDKPMFSTMLNAMNYFFHAEQYEKVWQGEIDPHTADSILQNYNHLAAGGGIYVVKGMFYNHLVHDGSHYKNNVHKTGNLYTEIEQKLKQLK